MLLEKMQEALKELNIEWQGVDIHEKFKDTDIRKLKTLRGRNASDLKPIQAELLKAAEENNMAQVVFYMLSAFDHPRLDSLELLSFFRNNKKMYDIATFTMQQFRVRELPDIKNPYEYFYLLYDVLYGMNRGYIERKVQQKYINIFEYHGIELTVRADTRAEIHERWKDVDIRAIKTFRTIDSSNSKKVIELLKEASNAKDIGQMMFYMMSILDKKGAPTETLFYLKDEYSECLKSAKSFSKIHNNQEIENDYDYFFVLYEYLYGTYTQHYRDMTLDGVLKNKFKSILTDHKLI